ncbi:hypothetical protein Tco_0409567 [Tanacetum coccineum]
MCTYLKNIKGWKHKCLKNKSFTNIQELFDNAFKRVNTFVDYRTELMEESSKKVKVMEENDGDDVTIDATPLSTKSPTIFDYKIYKEGKKSYFQIIRADDSVWKNQQGLVKVLNWKIYDSCGVYCVTMQSILYYMLVEKMYPLTNHTLHQMFNDVKLQVDYECEMAFELLRLLSMKKLEILKKNIKFRGGLLGVKVFLELLLLSTARVKLVLLVKIEENILSSYYCLLRVNAAGTKLQLLKVTTVERLQLLKDKDCLKIKITYEIRIVIYRIDL